MYLDWLADLPWAKTTPDKIDVREIRRVLDEDHYGLEKVKKRITEFAAVRQLRADKKGPILLFVGPPRRGQDLPRPVDRACHGAQVMVASHSAASAMKPRSAVTVAPTSERSPAA